MTKAAQSAELVRARTRLAKASDAWLRAEEDGDLSQKIVDEYYAAYTALVDLNDRRLFEAVERTNAE